MNKDYKVSKKQGEKWVNFGAVKKNQFGNYSLGIKNTPEFKALVGSSAEWLNFSLFEDTPKTERYAAKQPAELDDNVPF